MQDLDDLVKQHQQIEQQIAAMKAQAVAGVFHYMEQLGVTLADLGARPAAKPRPAAKRPVKYRDEQGNTWTGVGTRPRWLSARLTAGAALEQFAIRPDA
jgi:DNA-binding protein H-NS